MKASELMINDWVKTEGFAHKITGLQISFMERNDHEHYNEANTEPIPLTEEILKANGFVRYNDAKYGDNWGYGALILTQRGKRFIGDVCCSTFIAKYVHQLQHALRLCGLNDLADNFKIQ